MTKDIREQLTGLMGNDWAKGYADVRREDATLSSEGQDYRFSESNDLAMLSIVDEPQRLEMPDPEMAKVAVEMVMRELFGVFADTRLEEFSRDLAWGFCNSFHMVAKRIASREDDAERKVRDLVRTFEPTEVYANELEEAQLLCQTLTDCREAFEQMRDHASEVYRVETGNPFSSVRGSRVSTVGASQIEARDFLAARAQKRREEYAPSGAVVLFSGGVAWDDHQLLWARLDKIHARIPSMVLATTAQTKGCDAIAHAWAASRGVTIVKFRLDRAHGNRAAFMRNQKMVALRPVEAVVCEGSGVQANLAQRLRDAQVPTHIFRIGDQRREEAARA